MSSKLLKVACTIARADVDCAAESSGFDQLTIVSSALLLVCLGVVASLAWTAFWATFLPIGAAVPLGLLVGLVIFLMDQAISASDWELAGVLRSGPHGRSYWFKLGFRSLVAILLAHATATGTTIWMFGAAIDGRLQADRAQKTDPVLKEYAERRKELATRLVEPIEKELAAKREQRDAAQRRLDSASSDRDAAGKRGAEARIEAGREHDGGLPGYVPGDGPRQRDAVRRGEEWARLFDSTSSEVRLAREQVASLDSQVASLTVALREQSELGRLREAELDVARRRDPRLALGGDDPLVRFMALRKIESDAETGDAARYFGRLMWTVLLVLELSFLFVKVGCAPASVYMVRLIAKTKAEAAKVSAQLGRTISDLNGQRTLHTVRIREGLDEEDQRAEREGV